MTNENMMRAVTQYRFGGPDVLQLIDLSIPRPAPTELLVRVHAAGINPVDLGTRAGRGVSDVVGEPPFVLGWDVSGVVEAIAPGVTRFSVGDEVYGMPWFPRQAGGYADYVTAPARHFAPKPKRLDHEHAAALPLAGLTAWQVLVDTANVQPGQRVLVHAAAGGVGHLAVQIAKSRGAEVIGTASAAKHDALDALGIDQVIDYARHRFEAEIRDVDVVIDLVGGDYPVRSLSVLKPGGLLVHVPSDVLPDGLAEAAQASRVRATAFLVEPDHSALEQLAILADKGQLRPLLARSFPLAHAASAHASLEDRPSLGKTVLVP